MIFNKYNLIKDELVIMNLYYFLADVAEWEQEFAAQKEALNFSFCSTFGIVLILIIAIIVNHIRFKTLFTKSLIPFILFFIIHPAWFMLPFNVSSNALTLSSYGYLGLGVLWFVIFIIITKKPVKSAPAESEVIEEE